MERPEEERVDVTGGPIEEGRGIRERIRRRRERAGGPKREPGLIGLIPDSILPPEGKEHLWKARREALLAGRSLVRSAVYRLQDRSRQMRQRRRRGECPEEEAGED